MAVFTPNIFRISRNNVAHGRHFAQLLFLLIAFGVYPILNASPKTSSSNQHSKTRQYNAPYKNHKDMVSRVVDVQKLPDANHPLAPTIAKARLSQLSPTQADYGKALVQMNAKNKGTQAAKKGVTPLELVLERVSLFAIPVSLPPGRAIYTLDAHHDAWTNKILLSSDLADTADPFVLLNIVENFRNDKNMDNFYRLFESIENGGMGLGQFDRAMRHATIEEKIHSLPMNFDGMKDNPLRSLMGAALYRYGIDTDPLVKQIEFKVVDKLLDLNLMPLQNLEFTDDNVDTIAHSVFSDSRMRQFIRDHIREEAKRNEIDKQLINATTKLN